MVQNSYLLRFWRTHQDGSWRATLITVDSAATEQHFTTVTDLLIHLSREYPSYLGLAYAAPAAPHERDAIV